MQLLTRVEAAERLSIGLRTLDRRIADGQLHCHRLGEGPRAPVRISEDQIRQYLARSASHGSDNGQKIIGAIMYGGD